MTEVGLSHSPFSLCGLNEEKHFQYCSMTALKYDTVLHYIQLYITRNRPDYTPAGLLEKKSRLQHPFLKTSEYFHFFLFYVQFGNTRTCETGLAQPEVFDLITQRRTEISGLVLEDSCPLGACCGRDGGAPGIECVSLNKRSINYTLTCHRSALRAALYMRLAFKK